MWGPVEESDETQQPGRGLAIKLILTYVAVALVPLIMSGYIWVAYLQEFAAKVDQGALAPGELERYVRGARGISVMVGVFAIFMAVAMAVLITRWITGPLRQISRFLARAAQRGDFFDRLQLPLRDEIGHLAGNVNRLLDAIVQPSGAQHIVCSECGAGGDASDRFCRGCGRQVPTGE